MQVKGKLTDSVVVVVDDGKEVESGAGGESHHRSEQVRPEGLILKLIQMLILILILILFPILILILKLIKMLILCNY